MNAPTRVQLSRVKGWRMPDNTVKVSRPGKFGNPFKGEDGASTGARQTLVDEFSRWLTTPTRKQANEEVAPNGCAHFLGVPYAKRNVILNSLSELRGKNLACWCPIGQPCHADVLLKLANQGNIMKEHSALTDAQVRQFADDCGIDGVGYPSLKMLRDFLARAAGSPVAGEASSAMNFACYMVDNCEREIVSEEAIQRWLAAMLKNPRYAASPLPQQDQAEDECDLMRKALLLIANVGQRQEYPGHHQGAAHLRCNSCGYRWCPSVDKPKHSPDCPAEIARKALGAAPQPVAQGQAEPVAWQSRFHYRDGEWGKWLDCSDEAYTRRSADPSWEVRTLVVAAASLPVPAGMKLTPHQPTPEMLKAAQEQWERMGMLGDVWMAMWHAAPQTEGGKS